jgi:hypothetical protein
MKMLIPKSKVVLELFVLSIFLFLIYFLTNRLDIITLFTLGFVWNWSVAGQNDTFSVLKHHKFSMMNTIRRIHEFFLKVFKRSPELIYRLASILPAGLFWSLVIHFNESQMPWWATFLGSLVYEILQIQNFFLKGEKKEA